MRLWDMHNRTAEPVVLRGHEREVWAVAFSSDGRWLASGSGDQPCGCGTCTAATARGAARA